MRQLLRPQVYILREPRPRLMKTQLIDPRKGSLNNNVHAIHSNLVYPSTCSGALQFLLMVIPVAQL
jgi:hypothetical protein